MLAAAVILWPAAAAGAKAPIIAAAGDIACAPGGVVTATTCRQAKTAGLFLGNPAITAVLPLGDEQYETGALADFQAVYDATWGRALGKTHPVPGNHEYAAGSTAPATSTTSARARARPAGAGTASRSASGT